jgi:hypothetical protein
MHRTFVAAGGVVLALAALTAGSSLATSSVPGRAIPKFAALTGADEVRAGGGQRLKMSHKWEANLVRAMNRDTSPTS